MKAMKEMTSDEYREDIIRGELGPYILKASIAILQQSSNTLRYSIENVSNSTESFRKGVNTLNSIYATSKIKNLIQDGSCSYPSAERSCESGMALELKNVTFEYPGNKSTSSALRDVSLSIKPGQLVVIVGENGSGKSTIIKILTRLYDPTSGEVHIDGMPSSHYRMADLHHSTAVLSQDNHMYPLSLSENIGLGYVGHVDDASMISRAAELGGASSFISKLEKGIDTFLNPSLEQFAWNLQGKPDHPLSKELNSLEKTVDISGGERQRLVASRAFMRFNSGKVKFVAVDEPSSALDAEGELRLFQNLIDVRAGKTMIFVTHRFGHLTRYADQIICMKEGKVVEMGTHQSLMKADGEYAKLYNIQASAFSNTAQ
ncbi:P-loop containing nucleoside triphosphate hydrolase protein [Crucibulum laeve]|uniref:P-loop containing nucleoside triphosphate hydrolase protein n=1 Tax=Crucibulum laeve TaxID=68775 RepID=A0A5C3LZT1_9AGAR|nr:P-loop containing nucleoside triphosphate hydrolase protein [Crucibulum laeve]